MNSAVRIVIAVGVAVVIGWFFARMMKPDAETVEPVSAPAEPDETEAPTEELVEAPA